MPEIKNVNGAFDTDTTNAVKAFQNIFDIGETGVIDKATWYRIAELYKDIRRLEELKNKEVNIGENPPDITLSLGNEGEDVLKLQYILNYISEFYNTIPKVEQNGVFDEETKKSVIEFQKLFGLTADGNVREDTWLILYDVYKGIIE